MENVKRIMWKEETFCIFFSAERDFRDDFVHIILPAPLFI